MALFVSAVLTGEGISGGTIVVSQETAGSSVPGETDAVPPGEGFYGYALQDYFRSFDSGIEGAWAEPDYGELIRADPVFYEIYDIEEGDPMYTAPEGFIYGKIWEK